MDRAGKVKNPRAACAATVAAALAAVALVAGPALAVDPTWNLPAANLSTAGGNSVSQQVTASTDGTKLTTVWQRYAGYGWIVQASSSTDSGTTWSSPTDLSVSGGSAEIPQIASSADGTKLTAVWYRYNGSENIVQASTSTDSGTTWSTPIDLSAAGGTANTPHITSSTDGTRLTAVWQRYNGTYTIQASASTDSGATWSTPTDLSTTQDNYDPQLTASADGKRLTAVWQRYNGSYYIAQASTSTDSGTTWSTPTDLSADGGSTDYPQIASSADGIKLIATWYRYNGTHFIVQASTSADAGATPGAPPSI